MKKISEPARAAKAIKAELKGIFPDVKFSVKSQSFSMGSSVDIQWTDGPTTSQVDEFTSKYQYGHFDGMNDMYENSNSRDDIPQTKFVSTSREISEDVRSILMADIEKVASGQNQYDQQTAYYRILQKSPIPVGAKVTGFVSTGKNCGLIEDLYTIAYEQEQETRPEPVNVPAGKIQIIEYSPKSIAVIGETKPIKDELRSLGGKFNFRLTCGPGWIFRLTDMEKVIKFLSNRPNRSLENFQSLPEEIKEIVKKDIDFIESTLIPEPEDIPEEPTREEEDAISLEQASAPSVPVWEAKQRAEQAEAEDLQKELAKNWPAPRQIEGTNINTDEAKDINFIDSLPVSNEVERYNNLKDIKQAAKEGKVISIMNYLELSNKPKPAPQIAAPWSKHGEHLNTIPEGYTKSEKPGEPSGHLAPAQVKAYNSPKSIQDRKAGRTNTSLPVPQLFLF
jgi:hypothetical protein